jgi:hypothetical protein
MTKAFVSYAQADREAAERLVKELERLNITTTFLDRLVSPGDFWAAKLQSAIADSDVVFILISRESLKSEWVNAETALAVSQAERGRTRVVPVLLSRSVEVPPLLSSVQPITFYDESRSREQLDSLVRSIAERPSRTARETAQSRRAELDHIEASRTALQADIVGQQSRRAIRSSIIAVTVGTLATIVTVLAGAIGVWAVEPQTIGGSLLLFGLGALTGIAIFLFFRWIYWRRLKPLFRGTGTE